MRVSNATATSSQLRDSNADRRGELDDRGESAACAAAELGREGVGGGGGGLDAAAGNARSGGGDRGSAEAEVGGNAVGRDCGRAELNDGGGGAAAPADPPHRVRAAGHVSVGPQPHISASSPHSPPSTLHGVPHLPSTLLATSAWDRSQFAAHTEKRALQLGAEEGEREGREGESEGIVVHG
ncbi:unnamed protein product [Closterium sp. Naga37s-1]|nr:unnamed protein product [Closterium sp. Naga37s-1]